MHQQLAGGLSRRDDASKLAAEKTDQGSRKLVPCCGPTRQDVYPALAEVSSEDM